MSRAGTTRTKILSRRARGAKTARLRFFARRFGVLGVVSVLALWLIAWGSVSDFFARTGHEFRETSFQALAVSGYRVENILVEGRNRADPELIRAIVNLDRGDPLFSFNPAETKKMIERLSWVREAQVERRLPDTIYIGLTERQPLALWQSKGKLRVIDAEGVVLTDHLSADLKNLPIVVGEGANTQAAALLTLLAAEPDLRDLTESAVRVGGRRWDLKMRGDVSVRLPEGDPGFALSRLAKLQREEQVLEKGLSVIDLREPDRVIVRTRPGHELQYKAAFTPGSAI